MHIVFIVGSYYPYYSAVGKCVGNVVDELAKENKITVICQKKFTKQKESEEINNQKIIRVDTRENQVRNKLNEIIEIENGLKRKMYQLILNIYKVSRIVNTLFSTVTIKKDLVKEYLRALGDISEPIDLIIPGSMPFESVVASSKYIEDENVKSKIVPYLFDQFTESDTLHRNNLNKLLKRKQNLNLERIVFLKSHKILAMHSLKEHFSNNLPEIKNVYYVEHPLLLECKNFKKEKTGKITISYVGGLYKNYVEPNYFLKIYQQSSIKNAILHFYIIGNCYEIVNKYVDISSGKIINHGSVDKEKASKVVVQSDILISIAEKNGIQMSSKIFEYISNRKPIIHFYTVDNDVNLKILNKYPLSLCLKQDINNLDENVNKFNEFCSQYSNGNLSFEDVEKLYCDATPKYTANVIKELMKNN
ncbi:hypothetical protein [Clostridium sulfidigenes]|uniref:hypothetical protein n=1 Tax=Clostridium sulfidigenes TaxID=318464 RepID=UPI003F88837A